jgi:anti-sigma factor RsiW
MPAPHIEEDLLDRYAMGTLPGESVAAVEEHLLICRFCQNRLVETDQFVPLFRAAATQVDARTAPEPRRVFASRMVWAGALASAAALLVFLISGEPHITKAPPAILMMQSLRGPEAGARTAAGKPALLVFDLAIQANPADYEVEIVDAVGNEILQTGAAVKDGRLTVLVEKLARGSYWIRLYRKQAERELVVEYALRAE